MRRRRPRETGARALRDYENTKQYRVVVISQDDGAASLESLEKGGPYHKRRRDYAKSCNLDYNYVIKGRPFHLQDTP